jgi:hypothetical protein
MNEEQIATLIGRMVMNQEMVRRAYEERIAELTKQIEDLTPQEIKDGAEPMNGVAKEVRSGRQPSRR